MKKSSVYKLELDSTHTNKIDVFNLLKYRILYCVAMLNSLGCPVTTKNVWRHMHSIYSYVGIRSRMSEMSGRELTARYKKSKTDQCKLVYRLSAQGKRNLAAYQERHRNGFDLRLKKVPKKMDWSQIVLLPDYEPEEME